LPPLTQRRLRWLARARALVGWWCMVRARARGGGRSTRALLCRNGRNFLRLRSVFALHSTTTTIFVLKFWQFFIVDGNKKEEGSIVVV
jgi:hypothetical protein